MGGDEVRALVLAEPSLRYHPYCSRALTSRAVEPAEGHCLVGSLTGAVASKMVTEAPEGSLSPYGNRAASVKAQGSLTARPTSRADAKAGLSDPVVPYGRAIAQRIKGTPGITGLSPLSVHSGEEVWHLNIGVL